MNFIQDRLARGVTRPSAFEVAMPGWDGEESIVAWSIRMREIRRRREAARKARNMVTAILMLPVALLAGVEIGLIVAGWLI